MALETGSSSWTPYVIPKTPDVEGKGWNEDSVSPDPFVLSPKTGAIGTKNPSPQIEWTQLPINRIIERIEDLEEAVEALENRINNASIEASCENGNIVVTLNI